MWPRGLQTLCVVLFVSGWALSASVQESGQCAQLRRTLSSRGIRYDDSDTAAGSGAGVCGPSTPCCSPQLQQHGLKQLAQQDLLRALSNSTIPVQELLLKQAQDVQGAILRVIHTAREGTIETFNGGYPALASLARQPIDSLFDAFSQYFQSQLSDPELEDAVTVFFDELFPLAYQDAVLPAAHPLPESLVDCLRSQRLHLRPFDDAPLRMKEMLIRLLGTAKFYLQALYVGVEVLNTTTQFQYSSSCYDGLVRHDYCPMCHAVGPTVRPCMALCYNVMRGCIAPLSSLSQIWENYVNALARLSTSLQQNNDVKSYLLKMNLKMTEGMVNVWNDKENIELRVAEVCGSDAPPRSRQSTSTERSHRRRRQQPVLPYGRSGDLQLVLPQRQDLDLEDASAISLLSFLRSFNGQIELHRDLFKMLPDSTCSAAAMHELDCWNGRSVGSYGESLAEMGFESQAFNPEVTVPQMPDPVIEEKADRLDRIRQISLEKLMLVPSSDSLQGYTGMEGSGSGGWPSEYGDDEDGAYEYYEYYDYDGSGSGDGDLDSDPYQDGETFTEPSAGRDSDVPDMEIDPGTDLPPSRSDHTVQPVDTTSTEKPNPSAAETARSATCLMLIATVLVSTLL